MNYRSLRQLAQDVRKLSRKLPSGDFDSVVGVPKSGYLPAVLLAKILNKPLRPSARTLLIDDSVLSGAAMRKAALNLQPAFTAAVYVAPGKEKKVDFYQATLETPRVFEWNLWHHPKCKQFCFDIDGVLCEEPDPSVIDYGPKLDKFFLEARPLIVPSVTIGWLVTSRLEQYREVTKRWLALWGYKYDRLVMRPSRKQRHGVYKGEVYKSVSGSLFVESSLRQARQITVVSGKPVLCTETMELAW